MKLAADSPVAVIGAGIMGRGIASVAALAGHPVRLFDTRAEACVRAVAEIRDGYAKQVAKGRMTAEAAEAASGRVSACAAVAELAGCALAVEAVVEDLGVKRSLFGDLAAVLGPDAVLATNTSSLSITEIAAGVPGPERVVGMHFFNPAEVMPLVEVVSGLATDPKIAEAIRALCRAWKKKPVMVQSTPGFLVNRVARPFYGEAWRILQERAAAPSVIDAALRGSGGFRMGPFELMDMIGHDINLAVTKSVHAAFFGDQRYQPSLRQTELVAAGWLGRKTGRGVYAYPADAAGAVAEIDGPTPQEVFAEGDLGPAEALVQACGARGIRVTRRDGDGMLRVGRAALALSDGRTATLRRSGAEDLVLFDLMLDFAASERAVLAPADGCGDGALRDAAGLFTALGKRVTVIDDVPGMAVTRTVCMLVNEAVEAVHHGVASPDDVDEAMRAGVGYPRGPLEWGDAVGLAFVLRVLDNLAAIYGEDRYRASPLLRRKVAAGGRLAGEKTL